MRKRLTPEQRRRIHSKTHGRCAYCGCRLQYREMQVDHVKSLAHGGTDGEDNLLPACRSCNNRKGASTLESFRQQMERAITVLTRDSVTYRNAVRFGLIIPNPHPILFYFEKLAKGGSGDGQDQD